MRLMERIRQQGQTGLIIFIVIFVISIFAGLGVSTFNFATNKRQEQEQAQAGQQVRLESEGVYKDAAMVVNGYAIKDELLNSTLNGVFNRARQDANDPGYRFEAYGQVAMYLIRQEMIMIKADELGIKVTADDLKDEKDQAAAQYMEATEQGGSGNVVGDLAKRLSNNRDRQKAFEEFLMRTGLTEQQWEAETKRAIRSRKTLEAVQAELDGEKEVEATAAKAKVDEELAGGKSFEDVVVEFSEGPGAETGGDIGTWIQRGLLFSEDAEDVLFSTPVGEISEWIDIPAGFQRFEVYDKQEAEGPEFEAAKAGIIEGIKTDKGEDYIPTDEEIAEKFEKVKARQLVIKTTEPGAAEQKIAEEMESAKVEVNNTIILAYQALYADRLQPPAGYGQEQLEKFAENSAYGDGYDFSLIAAKLKKGLPKLPESGAPAETQSGDDSAVTETTEEGGEAAPPEAVEDGGEADAPATADAEAATGEPGAQEQPADESAAEADADPTMEADGATPVPIYALGIGLFKLALQEDGKGNGPFLQYMLAKTYLDWLADEDAYNSQPMDRPAARQEIEDSLAIVADSYEYSPLVHAYRGLNLAWLEEPDAARESLVKAQKYAPADDQSEAFAIIKEAYEVLDDTAKVAEIDQIINELRQQRLQRQIEQAQARQAQQPPQTPFQPGAGQPEAEGGMKPDDESGAAAVEETEDPPAEETPEPAPAEEPPADPPAEEAPATE